jgi:hypothetical protein
MSNQNQPAKLIPWVIRYTPKPAITKECTGIQFHAADQTPEQVMEAAAKDIRSYAAYFQTEMHEARPATPEEFSR